jgi:hypothetical protein
MSSQKGLSTFVPEFLPTRKLLTPPCEVSAFLIRLSDVNEALLSAIVVRQILES